MTPWGWEVGPQSPIYSETDLPQGHVPGYPPPADVPGSHSSLGILEFKTVNVFRQLCLSSLSSAE